MRHHTSLRTNGANSLSVKGENVGHVRIEAGVLHVNWTSLGHCVSRRDARFDRMKDSIDALTRMMAENGVMGNKTLEKTVGGALLWHNQFIKSQGGYSSRETYKQAVLARFGTVYDDPMSELKNLKYETTARVYQDAFDDLLSRVEISEDRAISLFMGGLPPEIAMGVRMFKPRKLADAYCLTNLQEATLDAVKKKNVAVAKKLGCPIRSICPLAITVGDGYNVATTSECKQFKWQLQGVTFCSDVMLLPLVCCDMILGIQWLSTLGTPKSNLEWMSGFKQNKIERQGKQLEFSSMQLCVFPITEVSLMRMEGISELQPELQTVVEEFADVFAIPKELPPSRPCDHIIPLLEGIKGTTTEIVDAYGGVLNFSQGAGNINVHKLVKSCRLEPIINPLAITAMNLDLKVEKDNV
ncbi:hypothetical protein Tco_1260921 [Tanacetum coccineum]